MVGFFVTIAVVASDSKYFYDNFLQNEMHYLLGFIRDERM